jgi:hypothetical protein
VRAITYTLDSWGAQVRILITLRPLSCRQFLENLTWTSSLLPTYRWFYDIRYYLKGRYWDFVTTLYIVRLLLLYLYRRPIRLFYPRLHDVQRGSSFCFVVIVTAYCCCKSSADCSCNCKLNCSSNFANFLPPGIGLHSWWLDCIHKSKTFQENWLVGSMPACSRLVLPFLHIKIKPFFTGHRPNLSLPVLPSIWYRLVSLVRWWFLAASTQC